MPAYLSAIPRPRCVVCDGFATQELRNAANRTVNFYCERHGIDALRTLLRTESTCPRCGGPPHAVRRPFIMSPEDDLWNDAIERECERRLLGRMSR